MSAGSEREAISAELRADLGQSVTRLTLIGAAVMLAVSLVRALLAGVSWAHAIFVAGFLLILFVYAGRERLGPQRLLIAVVVCAFGVGIAGYGAFGFFGNGAAFLLACSGLAVILYGGTAAWLAVIACSASIAALGAAWQTGVIGTAFDPQGYFDNPANWATASIVFVAVGAILIATVGRMTGRLVENARSEFLARQQVAVELEAREHEARELRETEERISLAFAASPDAIAIWHLGDRVLVEANDAFARLTGRFGTDLLGGRVNEVLAAPPGEHAGRCIDLASSLGEATDLPMRITRSDGEVREVMCSATRFESEGERFVLQILRDVTELRAAERSLERINAMLERKVAERTLALRQTTGDLETIAYAVSHNLRAPLRAIDAYADLFAKEAGEALPADAEARVERIRKAAIDMGELIDGLLELSRIGRRQLVRESVDLSVLAEEVVATLRAESPGREVELRIEPGMVAQADRVLMRLVLENLLGNAWKFTARVPRARIEFDCARGAEETVYSVRDNGAGFDMAYAGKLFEPFERLHAPKEFEGTGIGLATVARAMRRHDGRVWADSRPGHGANFRFTLGEPSAES